MEVNLNNKSVAVFTYLFIIILLTGIVGCQSGELSNQSLDDCEQVAELKQIDDNTLTVCDINLLKDTIVLPLSFFTEELHILQLDNKNDDYFVAERFVIVGEQYILVSGSSSSGHPYKLFDKSGNFIANIGEIGNGPNEYQVVYYGQLDEDSNCIYLLPYMSNKILMYDLKGNNYDFIRLPFRIALFSSFHINTKDSMVSVFTPPLIGSRFSIPYCAWVQNISGEIIHGIAPDSYSVGMNDENPFSNRIFKGNNTKELNVFFYNVESSHKDTLYIYNANSNKLIPRFTIDFKNQEIPNHIYSELPYHYIGYTYELLPDEFSPNSTIITNYKNFIVDKTTLKGTYFKLINDFLGNIEIEAASEILANGHYTANYEPLHLLEILEKALTNNKMSTELQKKLSDLKDSIGENDNNYIIYAKLK